MPAPQGRDLELLRKRLEEWFTRRLSDAQEIRVGELGAPGATGFSNDTVLFDLHYRQDGTARKEGLVCRIKPGGYPVFPEYDLGRQYRVMALLEATDVPVPRMIGSEQDESVLGAPFYVMQRVDGRVPSDNPPYHAGGWMSEITPQQREKIWWSGYRNLARIHTLDWQELGFGFLDRPELGETPLEQELAYYEKYLEWAARGRPQPTIESAHAWLRAHRPQQPEPVRLCWGDARIGNMIFADDACVAVLDWEMVSLGNPEKDLAWGLFLDRHHSEGIGVPRLEGFPGREQTIERWEQWTGLRAPNLHYYEVYAGFRFGVIMIRIAQQLVHYGMMPADSDFETNNIVTRLLAKLLDLPAPGGN